MYFPRLVIWPRTITSATAKEEHEINIASKYLDIVIKLRVFLSDLSPVPGYFALTKFSLIAPVFDRTKPNQT